MAKSAKLNQEDMNNLKRPITNEDVIIIIKSLSTKIHPGSGRLTKEFWQTFKEYLQLMLPQLLHKQIR